MKKIIVILVLIGALFVGYSTQRDKDPAPDWDVWEAQSESIPVVNLAR
jgi:hypothetical protein